MNATDDVVRWSATFLATVDLPEPDPPAIPMIKGFSILPLRYAADDWNALCPDQSTVKSLFPEGSTVKTKSLVVAILLAGAAACSTFGRGSGSNDPSQPTVVEVDNQGFQDMDVYAVRSGQRWRLGLATGTSKTKLTIPRTMVSGLTPLRFVADPIGGRRASVSQEITVAPGDTVVMTIPPG